jgi:hypothetical protein
MNLLLQNLRYINPHLRFRRQALSQFDDNLNTSARGSVQRYESPEMAFSNWRIPNCRSQLIQDGLGNLAKEFWPDLNRVLFHSKY